VAESEPARAKRWQKDWGRSPIGGSDSHAMRGVGLTYTEVPGAKTVAEFFAGLRAKRGKVRGADGSFAGLTADVLSITKALFQERPATLALAPLAALDSVITAGHWMNEICSAAGGRRIFRKKRKRRECCGT